MSDGRFYHVKELDGLRAVSILAVLSGHLEVFQPAPAALGVTIFFFISGYLITSLMRKEFQDSGTVSIRNFYIRRTLRIVPPLWLTFAFCLLMIALGILEAKVSLYPVLLQLFFFANYAHLWSLEEGGIPGISMWSLAVEEHFYLLFPLIFTFFLSKLTLRNAAIICALACVAVLAVRFYTYFGYPEYNARIYFWSHTRFDAILAGCCLALWNNPIMDKRPWRPSHLAFGLACVALALTVVFRDVEFRATIRYSIHCIIFYVMFAYILAGHNWTRSLLNNPVMQQIGLYSYTIYLIHVPMLIIVDQNFGWMPHWILSLSTIVATIAFAALMHAFVEKPIAALRKRMHNQPKDRHTEIQSAPA